MSPPAALGAAELTPSDANEFVLTLPATIEAVTLAREHVVHQAIDLPAWLIQDAALLVSEIVGNAVLHGTPEIAVQATATAAGIRVGVHDAGEQMPVLRRRPAADTEPGGRGMLIVDAVADAWGVDPSHPEPGKTVWFELRAHLYASPTAAPPTTAALTATAPTTAALTAAAVAGPSLTAPR